MNFLNSAAKPVPFVKAHGTGNDFIILDSVASPIDVTANQVQSLCNRHTGIGADGILRVAQAVNHGFSENVYFMDYRNADGSLAETCGNGLRVFARFLVEAGYEKPGTFQIATRAGLVLAVVRQDDIHFQDIAIQMGQADISHDVLEVGVKVQSAHFKGHPVFMPNPHCVVVVDNLEQAGSLVDAPNLVAEDHRVNELFPNGANVEFIEHREGNRIGMRTYERGVGETLACGSGACAAAQIWAIEQGMPRPWEVTVDVLGGTLVVQSDTQGVLTLRGPATVVAHGELVGDQWIS